MQAEVKELVELRRQIAEYDDAYELAVSPLVVISRLCERIRPFAPRPPLGIVANLSGLASDHGNLTRRNFSEIMVFSKG